MKTINVVAAIIKNKGKILATQRGYGQFKGLWEFPGGKIENNETPEEALIREIREELNASIEIESYIKDIEYDYPDFHLNMKCFLCELKSSAVELLEASDAKWLSLENIDSVNWLPADIQLLEPIKAFLASEHT